MYTLFIHRVFKTFSPCADGLPPASRQCPSPQGLEGHSPSSIFNEECKLPIPATADAWAAEAWAAEAWAAEAWAAEEAYMVLLVSCGPGSGLPQQQQPPFWAPTV